MDQPESSNPLGAGRKEGVTLADVEHRKQMVFDMMIQGLRPMDIFGLISANQKMKESTDANERRAFRPELDWGVQYAQVCVYYNEATARLKSENIGERTALFRQSVLRYDDLYKRCVAVKDYRGARQVMNDRNRLLALNDFDHGGETVPTGGGAGVEDTYIQLPDGTKVKV